MTAARDLLRGWLASRVSLGEPAVFLGPGDRERALAAVRGLAAGRSVGLPSAEEAGVERERPPPAPPRQRVRASAERGGGAREPDRGRPVAPPGRGRSGVGTGKEREPAVSLPQDEVERLGRCASAEEIGALPDLATVRAVALRCHRCPLHATRRHVVFADGSPRARLMCVGEAPGAVEDDTGLPFVGPAGKLLDRLLLSVGFRREEVYICNVLKCRPPNNRNPSEEEIARCSPFLLRQVAMVGPEVILALGTFAAQTLVGSREAIGRLRGRVHVYGGAPLVVTYHPAALLRNPGWTRPTWEDLQLARRIADGEGRTAGAPAAAELGLGL